MKNHVKNAIKKTLSPFLAQPEKITHNHQAPAQSQIEQKQLYLYYKQLLAEKKPLPSVHDVGFRNFSQNDEDGILLYLFALIGTTNKKCVDIAFANPHGSNVTNLICNFNWTGLLVCGSEHEITPAKSFFSSHPDTFIYPPNITNAWITAENVNNILEKNGYSGEIDLLSLDIDGVDYWVWKNIETVQPRIVVVEYMNIWTSEHAVTVPYSPEFNRFNIHEDFCGASLAAFVKLAKSKGYRLVACNKYGFNAFFVKEELAKDILPEITIEECLSSPQALDGQKNRQPHVAHLNWQKV
ncbi:MAG: hypothetical protein ABH827_05055 [bacterium]